MHSILSKEIYPNKAVLPDSIYAYASLANFGDFYATPATVNFVLSIRKSDILKHAESNYINNTKEFFLSKNSELTINNNIPYILDYDVKIIARASQATQTSLLNNKTDYTITAQYVMNELNPISDIKSPFIQSVTIMDGNEEYVCLRLKGRQMRRNENSYLIYTNDIVENITFEAEFTDQLADFNIFYKESSNSDEKILLNKYLEGSTVPDSSEKFCYFSLVGDEKIKISFSAHPSYFRPKFNSELLIETFSTLGSKGNFVYEGSQFGMKLIPLNEYQNYNSIPVQIEIDGESKNGVDSPSLSEIKEYVINEFSARKNIITETDLKAYFKDISEKCNITFVKKRDDIIKRIYTAFILMRNSNNEVIPTNTIDFLLYEDEFDNYQKGINDLIIKAGTVFEASENDVNFTKVNHLYNWSELVQRDSQPTNYLYGTPFLIKVNRSPLFLSYYINSIFKDYSMSYNIMNENSYEEFIVNKFSVTRNAIKDDFYTFNTIISTTLDLSDYDPERIKVIAFLEEDGKTIGYVRMNTSVYSDTKLEATAKIYTNDVINTDNKIVLTDSIYSINHYGQENLKAEFPIGSDNINVVIAIYYNGYPNNKDKGIYSNLVPNMSNYALCNAYKTEENVVLFEELNNIMQSTIILKTSSEPSHSGIYYKIKKSPMIRYLYLENDNNMREIIQTFTSIHKNLENMLPVVENNFNIDTKFYNTYGASKFFTIGRSKQNLNIVCISLKLNIKLATDVTPSIISGIKNYIVKFVENTNENETNYIYVSNLIRNLEQEFEEIIYIEFDGFNDYGPSEQIIENNFTNISELNAEQVINYVPEYLNINRHVVLDNGQLVFEPRITLNFV